jgi:hypothetical protein
MATFTLQVSGHGEDQNRGEFPVAENWQFNFFVKMGEILDYPTSEAIYQELAANNLAAVNKRVKNIYFAGQDIVNYAMWDLADSNYVSGVLQVGSTVAVVDIDGTTQQNPIMLSNLLALAVEALDINVGVDTVIVYFNACR